MFNIMSAILKYPGFFSTIINCTRSKNSMMISDVNKLRLKSEAS